MISGFPLQVPRHIWYAIVGVCFMAIDGIFIRALVEELSGAITGMKVSRIYQPTKTEICFELYRPGGGAKLLASASPDRYRLHLTEADYENPASPPPFCMLLRKYLLDTRILAIEQPGLERIARITFGMPGSEGMQNKVLVVEMMGKHSNIILLHESTEIILDSIKHVTHEMSRYREVLPGRTYVAPPASGKHDPLTIGEDEFRDLVKVLGPQGLPLEKLLLKLFDGIGPFLAGEISARAGLQPDTPASHLDPGAIDALWRAFASLQEEARMGLHPEALVDPNTGEVKAFSAVSITNTGGLEVRRFPSFSGLLDTAYRERERKAEFAATKGNLTSVVHANIERLQKKLALQEEELARAENADELKLIGDIILANLGSIRKGETRKKLINYYDPELRTVEVELDPSLTPQENAARYYARYSKAKKSLGVVLAQLQGTREELSYLENVDLALEHATSIQELELIREELQDQGYIKERKTAVKPRREADHRAAPLTFRSPDGHLILVGRNNRENDYLTMKLADDDDVWLHARGIPGAHVIVKQHQGPPSEEAILAGAMLAAFYSKGKQSQNVPVDYTLVKNVKKPRGARPGMVIYRNERTLFVTPEVETLRLQKLNKFLDR